MIIRNNALLLLSILASMMLSAFPPESKSNQKKVPRIHMACTTCNELYPFECKQIYATHLEKKHNGDTNLHKTGWTTLKNGKRRKVPAFNVAALSENHTATSLARHMFTEHPHLCYHNNISSHLSLGQQEAYAQECFKSLSAMLPDDESDPDMYDDIDPSKQEVYYSDDSRCTTPVDQIMSTDNTLSPPSPPRRERQYDGGYREEPAQQPSKQRRITRSSSVRLPQAAFSIAAFPVYNDFADHNNTTQK